MSAPRLRIAVLLGTLAFCGCDATPFGLHPSDFACASDADCESGLVCFDGACTAQPACSAPSDCPAPANAAATCVDGECRHGPCVAPFLDVDGNATYGCEAVCLEGVLTDGTGALIPVSACPPPETGLVAGTFAAGSSFGDPPQQAGELVNIGITSDPTPPGPDGEVETTGGGLVNRLGLGASE